MKFQTEHESFGQERLPAVGTGNMEAWNRRFKLAASDRLILTGDAGNACRDTDTHIDIQGHWEEDWAVKQKKKGKRGREAATFGMQEENRMEKAIKGQCACTHRQSSCSPVAACLSHVNHRTLLFLLSFPSD